MSQVIAFDDRPSDQPVAERIWRSRSDRGGPFLSVAATAFEMCVTRHQGRTFITLRGPETRATRADCPPDGAWLGLRFRMGTFMPRLTPGEVKDRGDATLPGASSRSFWLDGSAWDTVALGYPASRVVAIGVIELVALVLYLVPRTSVLGAVVMTGYLGGAIATHVRVGSPLPSHTLFPIYVALLVWGGLYLRDARLRELMPLRRCGG